jgi:hypothetical protein
MIDFARPGNLFLSPASNEAEVRLMRAFMLLFVLSASTISASTDPLALRAVNGDENAVVRLRAEGQQGVDRLVALHAQTKLDEERYRAVLDRVCAQRDCAWSRLYWYTDLQLAVDAARTEKKPILSLRLLGNLDDDMSCANSRFFRTILYSDGRIADYLRQNFILHWSSERAVPKVTIDFGDGRVMQRTLTGNSIHYLLDTDGQPLDALPGLYAPLAFLANIREMRDLFDDYQTWRPGARTTQLAMYHRFRSILPATADQRTARLLSPATAWDAASRAMSKGIVEAPILTRVSFGTSASHMPDPVAAGVKTTAGLAKLDENTLDLMRKKHGGAAGNFELAVERLQSSLAADTMRNEYELRPLIHRVFVEQRSQRISFHDLNAWVYEKVFLTPASDAWLGLLPSDTYTGLPDEGLAVRR